MRPANLSLFDLSDWTLDKPSRDHSRYVYWGPLRLHRSDAGLSKRSGYGESRSSVLRYGPCRSCGKPTIHLLRSGIPWQHPTNGCMQVRNSWLTECAFCRARPNHEVRKQTLYDWLKERPCTDCGYTVHPDAMEFDHRPGVVKVGDMNKLIRSTLSVFAIELSKCDLVCANCHRVRTAQRLHDD